MLLRYGISTIIFGTLFFTGCAKKPPLLTKAEATVVKNPAPITKTPPTPLIDTAAVSRQHLQSRVTETFKTIYFDYEKSELSPESRIACASIGELMKEYPRITVRIEGNADERGTEMYNLALGERRAKVAQTYLNTYGIALSRMSIISYGKEKPAVEGHDEEAWAKNRRDDFTPTF